jgi:hypothetical protein
MTTTIVTLVITHPDGTTADGLTQYTLAPMLRDINQDLEEDWNISLVVGEPTTTQQLILRLWGIINSEDDPDEVVTMICELLNETEATLNNKEKETTQ